MFLFKMLNFFYSIFICSMNMNLIMFLYLEVQFQEKCVQSLLIQTKLLSKICPLTPLACSPS